MRHIFRQYFIFSDNERRAVICLSALAFTLFLLPSFWKQFRHESAVFDETLKTKIDVFTANYKNEKTHKNDEFPMSETAVLFDFDPNKIGISEWQKLGLSEKQAAVIEKYKSKGGTFRKAEDIRKIFVLSEEQKEKLLPHIKIGTSANAALQSPESPVFSSIQEAHKKYERPKIDINTADSAAFEKLPMIGGKRAASIVKYRTWLGGFYSIEQVAEVYSIPDSVFQKIKPQLAISKTELKKININTADFETFRGHPYTRKIAGYILKYRSANGGFKAIDQICRVPEMTDSICQKLLPYIVVE